MKIGIISDTHDNIPNYEKAIEMLKEKGIKELIHCGDLCAPIITKRLVELDMKVHLVFGNTDDVFTTTKMCVESKNVILYGEFGEVEIDGLKIAIMHSNVLAEPIALSGKYDVVFYGHSHKQDSRKLGNTVFINPGEILGFKGTPSFAVFDTETKEAEFFELK